MAGVPIRAKSAVVGAGRRGPGGRGAIVAGGWVHRRHGARRAAAEGRATGAGQARKVGGVGVPEEGQARRWQE